MKHKFSDSYTENVLPEEDQGSFVRPIPKEEKIMTRPVVPAQPCSNAENPSMMPEPHSVFAEESLLNPITSAVVSKMTFPPATPIAVPEEGLEVETLNTLPGSTAITEKQPDIELAEGKCMVKTDMDSVGNLAEPKVPTLVRGKRRNNRKRTGGKKLKCNYILIHIIFK